MTKKCVVCKGDITEGYGELYGKYYHTNGLCDDIVLNESEDGSEENLLESADGLEGYQIIKG